MDWQLGTLAPAFRPLFIALVREKRKIEDLGEMHEPAKKLFRILDQVLAGQTCIAGEQMTLADIALGPMIYRWFALGLANQETPHLQRFLERLSCMPAFRKHVTIDLA